MTVGADDGSSSIGRPEVQTTRTMPAGGAEFASTTPAAAQAGEAAAGAAASGTGTARAGGLRGFLTDGRIGVGPWGASGFVRRFGIAFTAFLACCALLTAGLTAVVAHRGGRAVIPANPVVGVTSSSAPTDPSVSLARASAARSLLDRRASAVLAGRRADWDASLDASTAGTAFRSRQLAEFDRIRLLPMRTWRYQVLGTAPVTADNNGADSAFVARVQLSYRLSGDTRDVERTQAITVERRTTGWAFSALRRESGEADPWELGPITVTNGRRGTVVGIGRDQDRSALRRTAQEVDTAAARVDELWGSAWRRTVVVIAPATSEQLAAVVGRSETTGLAQIAAITNGELSRQPGAAAGAADRIVLNPQPFGALSSLGRRVVLTHELTHIATRGAARVPVPLWVDEGFASYVAYRGSGLSRATIASDVLPLVRAGTAASKLPEDADFDPAQGTIAPAYADAWLAFDLMARDGSRRPLEFYRTAVGLDPASGNGTSGSEESLSEAFRRVLGVDENSFQDRWRAYRDALAEESR